MTATSALILGTLAEDADGVRSQIWMYDNATILANLAQGTQRLSDGLQGRLRDVTFRGSEFVTGILHGVSERLAERVSLPEDPDRHANRAKLLLRMDAEDWKAAKVARLLDATGLAFEDSPTEAELHDLGQRCEGSIVELLRRVDGPSRHKKDGATAFTGSTIGDVARFVWNRMCQQRDSQFREKPIEEQLRIVDLLAQDLEKLPEESRARIRQDFKLDDLQAASLLKAGSISGISLAAMGTVGIGGFAAYTGLTSLIAGATGLVGLTLPFPGYVVATSTLAFLASPFALLGAGAIGWKIVRDTNKEMRTRIAPVMATFSLYSGLKPDAPTGAAQLAERLAAYYAELAHTTPSRRAEIRRTFPCLPRRRGGP